MMSEVWNHGEDDLVVSKCSVEAFGLMLKHDRARQLDFVGESEAFWLDQPSAAPCDRVSRKASTVDTKNIRKHANDVLRLSQLLAPDVRIPVVVGIAEDLNRFLDAIEVDRSIDPKSVEINNNVAEIVERIAQSYDLNRRREGDHDDVRSDVSDSCR